MVDPSKMTVAQLKEELDARGLSTTGKKEELKERLIEALDANEEEDEDEEEDIGPHYKEWDDKKAEVCARLGMPRQSPCLIIRSYGEDRSDSEDESPPTADEVAKIRVILGTDARMKATDRAMKFAQGQSPGGYGSDSDAMDSDDDYDDGFFCFTTANGNAVVMGLEAQINRR